jgi:hypothetical protein
MGVYTFFIDHGQKKHLVLILFCCSQFEPSYSSLTLKRLCLQRKFVTKDFRFLWFVAVYGCMCVR